MNYKNFSIKQAFEFGISTLVQHISLVLSVLLTLTVVPLLFLLLVLIATGILLKIFSPVEQIKLVMMQPQPDILFIISWLTDTKNISIILFGILGIITFFIFRRFLSCGWIKVMLELHDFDASRFATLFSVPVGVVFRSIVVSMLYIMAIMFGTMLLIIPGIIVFLGLNFAMPLLIDKRVGVFEALRGSWDITKGVRLKLLGFYLIGILIALGIGFVEMAVTFLLATLLGVVVLPIGIRMVIWISVRIVFTLTLGLVVGLARIFIYRKLS